MALLSDPVVRAAEQGAKRLDPGLVDLVKALARARAVRDIDRSRRGGKA